jgi:O-antigen/teichoic acid export membrane protein
VTTERGWLRGERSHGLVVKGSIDMSDKQRAEREGAFRVVGRLGWGIGDQILASTTNFVLVFLVARSVSPRAFGAFSLAYTTYSLALGALRAVVAEPLIVRYSSSSSAAWRSGVSSASGTVLTLGAVTGVACMIIGWSFDGPLRTAFLIIGSFLPLLLLQDSLRFAFFARGRAAAAFLNDAVWAALLVPVLAVLLSTGNASVRWLILAWGAAGGAAGLLGLLQARLFPGGPGVVRGWLHQHRDLVPRFAGEFAISSGTTQLTLFGIGGITTLAQVGILRAGQVALGPLNVLFLGAGMAAVPEAVRILSRSTKKLGRACQVLSVVLAFAALTWGFSLAMLPRAVGSALLEENWDSARSVLLPLTISAGGFGLAYGAGVGLRALAAAKRSLRARSVDALITIAAAVTGAALAGAVGAAWGYAISGCLRVPNWWWHFARAMKEHGVQVGAMESGTSRPARQPK